MSKFTKYSNIFFCYLLPSQTVLKLYFFTFKSRSRSLSIIFAVMSFNSKFENLQTFLTHFCTALTVSEILKFKNVYCERVGQHQEV